MLRCTIASLIPLIKSQKYGAYKYDLFKKHEIGFTSLLRHDSFYLLKEIPVNILNLFFTPIIPDILKKQNKGGTWKIKDGERITFDILTLLLYVGKLPDVRTGLKYDVLKNIKEKNDFYSVLIKSKFFGIDDDKTINAKKDFISNIIENQLPDGSWENSVVGTVINIENLIKLGLNGKESHIKKGIKFLFSNFNETILADHVGKPYGFEAHSMFTTINRNKEFKVATKLKPEWIPRNVCYRHLAVIQNGVSLNLLLNLGYENDKRIEKALDNLFEIEKQWNGFCDSNIKNPYLAKMKNAKTGK